MAANRHRRLVFPPKESRSPLVLRELIRSENQAEVLMSGHSMEPLLRLGDMLRIKKIEGTPKTGWVVLFVINGMLNTHRVTTVSNDGIFTRGDACAEGEGPIPIEDVIGRVAAYQRDGQWHSIEGRAHDLWGLALNSVMSQIKRLAKRNPQIRTWWASEQPLAQWLRDGVGTANRLVLGEISVRQEIDPQQVTAALVGSKLIDEPLVADEERQVGWRDERLLVAASARLGRVGSVLLTRASKDKRSKAGLISSLSVRLMARGGKVESLLIEEVEALAKQMGMKKIMTKVASDQPWWLGFWQAHGYHQRAPESTDGVVSTLEKNL